MTDPIARATIALRAAKPARPVGRVASAHSGALVISGLPSTCRIGDRLRILSAQGRMGAEVIRLDQGSCLALPEGALAGVSIGDPAVLLPPVGLAPDLDWCGRVIDPDGRPLDGRPLLPGAESRRIDMAPPAPHSRRAMGARISTGFVLFNTLLPIVKGQRIGLFAGSGVGKSTLLGDLAREIDADVVVIGLVGERGREVRAFVEDVLGQDGLRRAVVVAATSDRAPQVRRRCAQTATAIAESFRDQGLHVLLLIDSITRFAEAHREAALAAGESAAMRGFPASTPSAIAALCERAGPGEAEQGDITAVYSVLVSGSDMDEPVADMLRGVLDGHVVLDREIAERGRFPAVDVLRSVSRSLPKAATPAENQLIAEARSVLAGFDRVRLMVQAGLYASGADPATDRAIELCPKLEELLSDKEAEGIAVSFARLSKILENPAQVDTAGPSQER